MPRLTAGTSAIAHTVLTASAYNTRFANVENTLISYGAFLDDIQTFTAAQTFSGAVAMSGGLSLSTTGLTIAPQTAITFSNAAAQIIPGATSVAFRNNANSADNLSIADAGTATFRAGIVVAGSITGVTSLSMSSTLTAGGLTVSGTSSKIIASATSLLIRDNADANTNISILDSGNTTIRGTLTVSGGTISSCTLLSAAGGFVILGTNGGMSTSATTGFPAIPWCNGVPTGAIGTAGAIIIDIGNNRLYVHNGTIWKFAALT